MKNTMSRFFHIALVIYCCLVGGEAFAQQPTVKVDLDFAGRKAAEVNEPGYQPWVIEEGRSAEFSAEGLQFKFDGAFRSNWYKAGVQAPYWARLSNDGLVAEGQLTLTISGLPSGKHSLLTYHNTLDKTDNPTAPTFRIQVAGTDRPIELSPSNRVGANAEAATAYLTFEAIENQPVVLRFSKAEGDASSFILNGFELNTPNMKLQAKRPFPADGEEHVEMGTSLRMDWEPGEKSVRHHIYFGTSKAEISAAEQGDSSYQGVMDRPGFVVKDLYSLDHYYWRVDEESSDGRITKGDVWYFQPAQLAFPGAEGYGRYARGGRGGKVVTVTNLHDDGPGSLREAITSDIGPRTIVFAVGGTIELESRLVANQPYITIAGQTAPGKGIMISRAPLGMTGNDGIVRFMRVGIGAGRTYDGMGLTGANHSIMDHCSIRWTIDESFSSRGAHNITLQRTLIAEALNVADHGKYAGGAMHGYAATIGGDIGSFHHNLLAHCYGRNWSMGGGLDGNGYSSGRLDIRNNVVYNWGKRTTDGGAHEVNFVNNYYKPGPSTVFFKALKAQHEGIGKGTQQYYFAGNVMPGYFGLENQEEGRMIQGKVDFPTFMDQPFFPSFVTSQSAEEAYKRVLSDVGANQPVLDEHDSRIIQETLDGSYRYKGSISGLAGMPDTEQDVGGWEEYPEVKREENWDSDADGLPDWWELAVGSNPHSSPGDFSEANADPDRDGFTELEDYLNWLAEPHYFLEEAEALSLDIPSFFRGYTMEPQYKLISHSGNLNAEISGDKLQIHTKSSGFAEIQLAVEDPEGGSMQRTLHLYIR
ncbi:T9SS C-terminal target domain-containing protein [Echinicola pacifica]|nr:T9SS C-terminal target domain-containing protein [Echinicola pacifica]